MKGILYFAVGSFISLAIVVIFFDFPLLYRRVLIGEGAGYFSVPIWGLLAVMIILITAALWRTGERS